MRRPATPEITTRTTIRIVDPSAIAWQANSHSRAAPATREVVRADLLSIFDSTLRGRSPRRQPERERASTAMNRTPAHQHRRPAPFRDRAHRRWRPTRDIPTGSVRGTPLQHEMEPVAAKTSNGAESRFCKLRCRARIGRHRQVLLRDQLGCRLCRIRALLTWHIARGVCAMARP